MQLFEELRRASQDSCELDIDPHRSWDVCPNSPKSGKWIIRHVQKPKKPLFEKLKQTSQDFCELNIDP